MDRKLHLVYIPVTGVGIFSGFRGLDWFKYRLEIFKNYTLKSLVNQDSNHWILWLSFRPEEAGHPYLDELSEFIKQKGIKCIMTFDGLMYWDDKFAKELFPRLKNLARIIRKGCRERDFSNLLTGAKEIFKNKNRSLPQRLRKSLAHLADRLGTDWDWVYMTRIDSDDMFHCEYLNKVISCQPFLGALTLHTGYVFDAKTKSLGEWVPKTNPPFYTVIFPRGAFFDPVLHLRYYDGYRSHEDIPLIFDTRILPDFNYLVLTHSIQNQISTTPNHPFRREIQDLTAGEKEEILKDFGING